MGCAADTQHILTNCKRITFNERSQTRAHTIWLHIHTFLENANSSTANSSQIGGFLNGEREGGRNCNVVSGSFRLNYMIFIWNMCTLWYVALIKLFFKLSIEKTGNKGQGNGPREKNGHRRDCFSKCHPDAVVGGTSCFNPLPPNQVPVPSEDSFTG